MIDETIGKKQNLDELHDLDDTINSNDFKIKSIPSLRKVIDVILLLQQDTSKNISKEEALNRQAYLNEGYKLLDDFISEGFPCHIESKKDLELINDTCNLLKDI